MPQMSPSNWIILFLYFNLIMMFIITYNHFHYNQSILNTPLFMTMNKYSWQW